MTTPPEGQPQSWPQQPGEPSGQQPQFNQQPQFDPQQGQQPQFDPQQGGQQPQFDPQQAGQQPGQQPGGFPQYGPMPGQPGPGQSFGPPPGYQMAPGVPMAPGIPVRPRRRTALWIRLGILGVVVIIGIIVAVVTHHTDPGGAAVGDCLSGSVDNADSVKKVDCTDSTASYKVLGTLDNQTQDDFNNEDNPCTQWQNADAAFWEGQDGDTGTTLCLQSLHG
jgi:hypothetical protein